MNNHLHEPGPYADVSLTTGSKLRALTHASLPELPRHFVGRDEVASTLATTLTERRLVAVVGPGGLGLVVRSSEASEPV